MHRSRRLSATITGLTLALLASACATAPAAPDADVYHGFTLIDPATERRVENAFMVVENGMIKDVGVGTPPEAAPGRSHDMNGRFVLPGFIDAHAHITLTGIIDVEMRDGAPVITMETDDRITQINARMALSRGVTTVRDPGSDPNAAARYDAMIASGAWIGPEALHAGSVIEPPPFSGGMFAYPRTEAEWDAEAARQAALGMRYFKLYTDLTEAELASGIRAAHAHGLIPIAHLNAVSWTRAAELGIEGLEHALPTTPDLLEPGAREQYDTRPDSTFMYRWFELADYDGPLMQNLFALLAEKQVITNMTFNVNALVYGADDLDRVYPLSERVGDDPARIEAALAGLRRQSAGWTEEDFRRARAVMPKVLEFGRRLHEAGVPMLIGTDGGGGVLYARELEMHVEAGIPVWDVLQMATSGSAEIMGLGDRIGRVQEGYEADLVILDADPLAGIAAANQVYGVLNNGALLRRAELIAPR